MRGSDGLRTVRRTLPGPRVRAFGEKGCAVKQFGGFGERGIVAAVFVRLLQAGDERMLRVEFEIGFPTGTTCPEARYMRASAGVMPKVSVIRQAGDSVRRVDNRTSLT